MFKSWWECPVKAQPSYFNFLIKLMKQWSHIAVGWRSLEIFCKKFFLQKKIVGDEKWFGKKRKFETSRQQISQSFPHSFRFDLWQMRLNASMCNFDKTGFKYFYIKSEFIEISKLFATIYYTTQCFNVQFWQDKF